MAPTLTIQVLDQTLAICRLAGDAPLPDWCSKGSFISITRTPDELSLVCEEVLVPEELDAEKNWRALKVKGPLDFSLTGILASLVTPLAKAAIPVFAISTYDTDYLLLKQDRLQEAIKLLNQLCHIERNPQNVVIRE